jgi:hypothetical protein
VTINSTSSDNARFSGESSGQYALTVGTEYKVFHVGDISFLTLGSLGYSYMHSDLSNRDPEINYGSTYSLTLGVGAEYFISQQLSLSGYETAIFSYKTDNFLNPQYHEIYRSVDVGEGLIGLNFYF